MAPITVILMASWVSVPPPTEKISRPSFALSRLPLSHSAKIVAQPSSFVARQFGDIVRRRISLEAADFAEIVDGVAGVGRAAADAEDEKPPAALAHTGEFIGAFFDPGFVQLFDDLPDLVEKLPGECHIELAGE